MASGRGSRKWSVFGGRAPGGFDSAVWGRRQVVIFSLEVSSFI